VVVAVHVFRNEFSAKPKRLNYAIVIQHRVVPLAFVHVILQHKKGTRTPFVPLGQAVADLALLSTFS
jgi:hypothetical protein